MDLLTYHIRYVITSVYILKCFDTTRKLVSNISLLYDTYDTLYSYGKVETYYKLLETVANELIICTKYTSVIVPPEKAQTAGVNFVKITNAWRGSWKQFPNLDLSMTPL